MEEDLSLFFNSIFMCLKRVFKGNILKTKQVISVGEIKKLVGSLATVPQRGLSLGLVLYLGLFRARIGVLSTNSEH